MVDQDLADVAGNCHCGTCFGHELPKYLCSNAAAHSALAEQLATARTGLNSVLRQRQLEHEKRAESKHEVAAKAQVFHVFHLILGSCSTTPI